MKKLLLFLAMITGVVAIAQTIPNGGFESWTMQTLYSDPNGYNTSNLWMYQNSLAGNVTQDPGAFHLNSAARLTTVASQNDTTFGALIIGTAGPNGIQGGIPYTGQPNTISGYVKHSIQPNDTAFFIVAFKNNGNMIGFAVTYFTGNQTNYLRFTVPTNLPPSPAPDSIIAIITSSRLDPPRMPGSTITIDSLTMIGSTQQLPNPSFENWTAVQREEPNNWTTINFASSTANPSASKTTQSYSGTYALLLKTVAASWGDTIGYITNGTFGPNGPRGGMQVFQNPMKVSGYYKYIPLGNDTALAGAFTYINGTTIDSVMLRLNATPNYTYFEMNLTYNSWPLIDTLGIAFAAADPNSSTAPPGSALYIDALTVTYYPLSTPETEQTEGRFFPNPMVDQSILLLDQNLEKGELLISDLSGRIIQRIVVEGTHVITIDRKGLQAGTYIYTLNGADGKQMLAGKFAVSF